MVKLRTMDLDENVDGQSKITSDDLPKVHKKCIRNRPRTRFLFYKSNILLITYFYICTDIHFVLNFELLPGQKVLKVFVSM